MLGGTNCLKRQLVILEKAPKNYKNKKAVQFIRRVIKERMTSG
jgi:hypothetical protein